MRILIYRLGSLGDTVLALPCFRLIRESYPSASITVLTNTPISGKAAPLESILAGSGLVDAAIYYPVGLRNPRQLAALCWQLREQKFDLLISLAAPRGLAASLRDYLFFKAAGISRIMGIPFRRHDLINAHRADGILYESEAERLIARIRSLGPVDLNERKWLNLGLTGEEEKQACSLREDASIKGRFIAASLGTKTPLNDWGASNWSLLLREVSGLHPTLALILLGSADEFERSQELLASWNGPSANLCGKSSPRVSAALLSEAALFVGHDSGPMHLAAVSGARCIAIFSARCLPGQWFPIGAGHTNLYPFAFFDLRRTRDLAHQQKALASIRVEDVVAAIRRQLELGDVKP